MITNDKISEAFSLLGKLADIHGEDSFKVRSFGSAAFAIDQLTVQLHSLSEKELTHLNGIGKSMAKHISELLQTGNLGLLEQYLASTPKGVLEMLSIKGLGPKKIHTIWKTLDITSVGELLYACNENRLLLYKGFGEKTQENIKKSIQFYLSNQGSFLFQEIEKFALNFTRHLSENLKGSMFCLTGSFRSQDPVIDSLSWVTTASLESLKTFLESCQFQLTSDHEDKDFVTAKGKENLLMKFYLVTDMHSLIIKRFQTTGSEEFQKAWKNTFSEITVPSVETEQDIFKAVGLSFISPCQREKDSVIVTAKEGKMPTLITPQSIKGIIHCHTQWSDGSADIETMVQAAIERKMEYLVLSDHSQSAAYANGLKPERIVQQHLEIERLNVKYAPFKIFKSIESDILNDGGLDYENEVLQSFDLVIASVHSNLGMNQEKAMARLLKAIENPYTSILGHPSGRLLLSRKGYPLDYEVLLSHCAKYNVAVEINAHPRRLDLGWEWISTALDMKVLLSINPDAHAPEGMDDIKYGVFAAQKGGLTSNSNLSSFSLAEMESFVLKQKMKFPKIERN